MTTFDTESELAKVANAYPAIKLVLRVRCDDPEVRASLMMCSAVMRCPPDLRACARHLATVPQLQLRCTHRAKICPWHVGT